MTLPDNPNGTPPRQRTPRTQSSHTPASSSSTQVPATRFGELSETARFGSPEFGSPMSVTSPVESPFDSNLWKFKTNVELVQHVEWSPDRTSGAERRIEERRMARRREAGDEISGVASPTRPVKLKELGKKPDSRREAVTVTPTVDNLDRYDSALDDAVAKPGSTILSTKTS